jgi:hypothetical protein
LVRAESRKRRGNRIPDALLVYFALLGWLPAPESQPRAAGIKPAATVEKTNFYLQ